MRPNPFAPAGVLATNLRLLEQGEALIGRLPLAAFAGPHKPVGPHFRHVLEHYSRFLAGLDAHRIDYDARAREARLEVEPEAARARIRELIAGLARLDGADIGAAAEVRLECGQGDEAEQWSRSTLRRELQFLLSHTVHHYALIGLLLERHGIDPGADFGVAPSTLEHWRSQAQCAPRAG